jgi:hypothetical protein
VTEDSDTKRTTIWALAERPAEIAAPPAPDPTLGATGTRPGATGTRPGITGTRPGVTGTRPGATVTGSPTPLEPRSAQ